jgi:tripartite-type tricarboxylate transporter receptor subunit TctC
VALGAWNGLVAAADPYPVKPVRLIVPYAAGGTGDIIGRLVGGKLSELLGQSVIVENRPGAGGNIGAEATVRAAPDGYTVVIAATSLASNPSLQKKMPFDPLKDLAAVGGCCEVATILVVHPSLPVKSVKELVALAKANPAKLSFASSGFGTTSHLAAELFKVMARVDLVHVPYKADSAAMPDVLSGRVTVMFMLQTAAMPQIKARKLHALAVSTAQRSPLVPDLPTVAEAALPGYEISAWFGLFVPARTPREIVERLGAASVKSVLAPDMKERLLEQGFMPIGSPPDQFAAFFRGEVDKWARVVKEGKLALID